jgi:Beta-lactamase enzyme family
MKKLVAALFCLGIFCLFCVESNAQKKDNSSKKSKEFTIPADYKPITLENSPALQTLLNAAVGETLNKFKEKNLAIENVAVTLIDMRDPNNLKTAGVRGDEKIYPASVVKMFYMNALERWLEDGKVKMSPELERGLRDMITVSSNEATQYILDVLAGTSSGAEMSGKDFEKWAFKRNIVNRFYVAQGYQNINVNQKTFCEDAYGIEQQFRGANGENRNKLTTNAVARLLTEIVLGKTNTTERTKIMMDLMKRDWEAQIGKTDDREFISYALKPGTKLWTKEGDTSKTRHDAAYIETPEGLKFVIVIFTENFATERDIIPTIASKILEDLGKVK